MSHRNVACAMSFRLTCFRACSAASADSQRPELARHVLRFEVREQTLAVFREALACLREQSGERLDEAAPRA